MTTTRYTTMHSTDINTIDLAWSVNELLRRLPDSVRVLNALGIDTCCGGTLTLEEAALDANLPPRELLAALEVSTSREGARPEGGA